MCTRAGNPSHQPPLDQNECPQPEAQGPVEAELPTGRLQLALHEIIFKPRHSPRCCRNEEMAAKTFSRRDDFTRPDWRKGSSLQVRLRDEEDCWFTLSSGRGGLHIGRTSNQVEARMLAAPA